MAEKRKTPKDMTPEEANVEIHRLHEKMIAESRELARKISREIDECKTEITKKGLRR